MPSTSVAVATDSTNYLPRARAEREEIHQVSLYVGWQGQPERELEMDGFDEFYERLRRDPELPTTSQPSIGDFLRSGSRSWRKAENRLRAPRRRHLRHLRGRSPGARAAHRARPGRAREVIDGETACGGVGLLRSPEPPPPVRAAIKRPSPRACARPAGAAIWFCLDTLEYLRRGGRVGKAQAWLGGTLKIKPILSLEYEITPVERVRTAGRAFERMVKYAQELQDNRAPTAGSCSTFRRPSRPSA